MVDLHGITWIQWAQGAGTFVVVVLGFFLKRQVTQLHIVINSKMDALLELTRVAAKAEGKEEERNAQIGRESQQALGAKAAHDQEDAAALQMDAAKTQEVAASVQLVAAKKAAGEKIPRGSNTP